MAPGEQREIHDVEQTKKMNPFITRETTYQISELVFGINIFDLDFGTKLILSNNQSNSTLWVLDIIIGLLPLMIILITASSSSKMYNCALH